MKTSKAIATILIAAGLSTSAQANTSPLDKVLSRLASAAISVTVDELNTELEQAVNNIKVKAEAKANLTKPKSEAPEVSTTDTGKGL